MQIFAFCKALIADSRKRTPHPEFYTGLYSLQKDGAHIKKRNGGNTDFIECRSAVIKKIILVMNFTAALLLICCLQVSAALYSQSISFSGKDIKLEQVFTAIEQQTGYTVVGNVTLLKNSRPVTIQARNEPLSTFISRLLAHQPVQYTIRNKTIILSVKPETLGIEETTEQRSAFIEIHGRVTDTIGTPLAGASVKRKGTKTGVTTNSNGEFSIKANEGETLVISFVGYETQELNVTGTTRLLISMKQTETVLDQMVVIGYGAQKKGDLTGAISSVKSDALEITSSTSIEDAMKGKLAGVTITSTSAEPGGGVNISIRGASSISGFTGPLYVIDGFPLFNDESDQAGEFQGNSSSNIVASMLNPEDIASVEVLKDATATAIYGSRGANGVIIITTKQGNAGKARIDVQHYTTYNLAPRPLPLADAFEYANYINAGYVNAGGSPWFNGAKHADSIYYPTPDEIKKSMGEGTNWQDAIFHNTISQNYNIAVSGGQRDLDYYLSANYLNDDGIIRHTGFKRGSVRSNMNLHLSKSIDLGLNIGVTKSYSQRGMTSNNKAIASPNLSGVIWQALRSSPLIPTDFVDFGPTAPDGDFLNQKFNPVADLNNMINESPSLSTLINFSIKYKFNKNLALTSRTGGTLRSNERFVYWPLTTPFGLEQNQYYHHSEMNGFDWLNETYLTYDKRMNKNHYLNIVAGGAYQNSSSKFSVYVNKDFSIPLTDARYNLGYALQQNPSSASLQESKLISAYGRINYTFKNRYLFTATIRTDGSSRFAITNKWATFPSGAFAWKLSNEPFMRNLNAISNAKIRLSYGITGNQAITPYQSLARLGIINFSGANGILLQGIVPVSPGNSELKWEKTKELNVGLDISFSHDKYKLTFELYKKNTTDLLQNLAVPFESGYTTMLSNVGAIDNHGFELELSADLIGKKNFKWNVSGNLSSNHSTVKNLGKLNYIKPATFFEGSENTHILKVEGPIGSFWGYRVADLLSQQDIDAGYPTLGQMNKPGMFKFRDLDNNGIINEDDKQILGNGIPNVICGFTNTFQYKRFSLISVFYGALGQKVLNLNKMLSEYGSINYGVPSKAYLQNNWSAHNSNAYYPAPMNYNPGGVITDRLVENGSFIRLGTLTFRYSGQLPAKVHPARSFELYVTGANLLLFTKYSGYDPEVSALGQDNLRPGVDMGAYPREKSITIGINLKL